MDTVKEAVKKEIVGRGMIGQQTTELLQGLCFLSFQGLCFQTQFQKVGKYSSDVTATKFLYLEDESWPK